MKTEYFANNRKANFDYEITDTYEAGIVLIGKDVKRIIEGKASLDGCYCDIVDGVPMLLKFKLHTDEVSRKILLNKKEIQEIKKKILPKGMTLIPLDLHYSKGFKIKVQIGVCKGRKNHDKREHLKEKESNKEIQCS